ncbi:hypothetical protein [Polyangium jinanense]|uniref:Uncharacterized protein n=1 Tax=Polyangium jinanense TaxID=2829994 RepID=A0A9X4AX21_9BACT|nr:hypothetical protein [Polyangium jinanense]MDC3985927.1 hypothetical protein [Polyangium jinanense]
MNDELVLDAGDFGPDRMIRPPARPMYQQIFDYLMAKPDPVKVPSGTGIGREGVAATAVCIRWGSYFAVLADRSKPMWSEVASPETSRISDDEMARINIEASAALAHWVDVFSADWQLYGQLVNRAVVYLPMPKKTSKPERGLAFVPLAVPEMAKQLVEATDAERLALARADASHHPSRVFANALVNVAWRNGPIENIHAGLAAAYPIDRCRVTAAEERELVRFTSNRMAAGMDACLLLRSERQRFERSWPEQVLPYRLASFLLITPTGWTLTETSRDVRLMR